MAKTRAQKVWDDAWDVLNNHGYADSDVYGECFCSEVYPDSLDMAAHQLEHLAMRGVLIRPAAWVPGGGA